VLVQPQNQLMGQLRGMSVQQGMRVGRRAGMQHLDQFREVSVALFLHKQVTGLVVLKSMLEGGDRLGIAFRTQHAHEHPAFSDRRGALNIGEGVEHPIDDLLLGSEVIIVDAHKDS
jgi:hypothetical protein